MLNKVRSLVLVPDKPNCKPMEIDFTLLPSVFASMDVSSGSAQAQEKLVLVGLRMRDIHMFGEVLA